MKILITETQYSRAIDQLISYYLEPHDVKPSKSHPSFILWVKDGNIIAQIRNSNSFWVNKEIWNNISKMFNLEEDEVQSHLKIWLEQHYDLGGLTPYAANGPLLYLWKNVIF